MFTIAICDDEKRDAEAAERVIRQALETLPEHCEILRYERAEDIRSRLLTHQESLDLLVLDIDMPGITGLELAELLREQCLQLLIIFLSNHEEFVFKAIEFQPFRYIRKTRLEQEMPPAIRAAMSLLRKHLDSQLILNTAEGNVKIMRSDILYFEAAGHKVRLHLCSGKTLAVRRPFSELLEELGSASFVMIHRSCAVNADHVDRLDEGVVYLDNGERQVISRTRCKEVRKCLLKHWGESI